MNLPEIQFFETEQNRGGWVKDRKARKIHPSRGVNATAHGGPSHGPLWCEVVRWVKETYSCCDAEQPNLTRCGRNIYER